MSENAEVVRKTLEAFNTEGVEVALRYFDPEVEWRGPPEWLEKHIYRGHDGIREIAALWRENFEKFRLDLEKTIEAGGHGEIRDGKGSRVQVYFSWEERCRRPASGNVPFFPIRVL